MRTNATEKLEAEIEEVVRKHLAAYQAAAAAAVERAFASTTARPRPTGTKRGTGPRRPPTEVAALAERVYEAVRAHPGETMAVIAPHVGEPARALHRPMTNLKRSGRVRSAGQRHMTRYFPTSS